MYVLVDILRFLWQISLLPMSLPRKFPLLPLLHLLIPTQLSTFSSKSLSPRSFCSTDLSLAKVSLICVPIALNTFPTWKIILYYLFVCFPARQSLHEVRNCICLAYHYTLGQCLLVVNFCWINKWKVTKREKFVK